MAATSLLIADTLVQQDADGRFSLNDLHRAAGGEDRHKPGNWLRSQQAQDLIQELSAAQIRAAETVAGGAYQGTFVVRELVYAYAMWISARFHLQVIRAYDALVAGAALPPGVGAAPALSVPHLLAAQRQAQQLVQAITASPPGAAQQLLYRHLQATQRLLGCEPPALAELVAQPPVPPAHPGQGTLPGMPGAPA